MKTSHRITLYTALLVGTMSAVLIGTVYYEVSRSFYNHIQHQQESNMRVAQEQLDRLGSPLRIEGGKLWAGSKMLNGDQVLVDHISSLVGGIATVFQQDMRIATNIRLPDGSRAVGTKLLGPARAALLDREMDFRGEAKTLGESYLTAYNLLRDEQGTVVGMLQVGVLKKSYFNALTLILIRSFFIVFVGMLVIGCFVHWVMNKLTRELEAVGESRKILLRSTFSGVFGVDARGQCTFINHVGANFLGGLPEDFVGKEIHRLIHHGARGEAEIAAADCPLCQVFQSGNTYHNTDDLLWRLDQAFFPVEIQSFPLTENNRISGAIVAFSDITDRKRIAREMETKNQEIGAVRFAAFYMDRVPKKAPSKSGNSS
jgi:PAS domain-containing protein